jgi:hypothetical protein
MKRENFNLIVNTLDDQTLYLEICRKIKETESISCKLLGLVPVISGLGIVTVWLFNERFSIWTLVVIGLFGALITYSVFCWEKSNLLIGDIFRSYAEVLEARKAQMEDTLESTNALAGPYSLLRSKEKPQSLGNFKKWGKVEAETAIYGATILFWLLLPLLKWLLG